MFLQRSTSRRALFGGVAAATALGAVGCSTRGSGTLALPPENAGITDSTPFFDLLRPQITTSVRDKAVGLQPGDPVRVSVRGGVLDKITLTNPDGKVVPGEITDDRTTWHNTEKLGFGREYALHVEANGLGGKNVTTETFTTTYANNKTRAYFSTADNAVVGVGQTVGVKFDERIGDRRAAQETISVITEPRVPGAFYWISGSEVRWRPEHFFEPGTKVTVKVSAYGVDLGDGLYVDQDQQTSFTIGDKVIAKVSDKDKILRVFIRGELVKQMPTSMGEPNNPTPRGIYFLGDHNEHMIMDSSTFGVPVNSSGGYRTEVDSATQMSYNGIYVHSAPWSIYQQGVSNVSHGCLNVSPANAKWFLENTSRGDVVIVSDTQADVLSAIDGLGDWNMPWNKWKAGNAGQD